jgi:hypothetical protein
LSKKKKAINEFAINLGTRKKIKQKAKNEFGPKRKSTNNNWYDYIRDKKIKSVQNFACL